jgi:hypothetical protein
MSAPAVEELEAESGAARPSSAPACPCGGEMWFLRFGYDSWVCRRNTRHWFRPRPGRWSRDAQALGDGAG